jgi:phosphohistidine phosphatase SixA
MRGYVLTLVLLALAGMAQAQQAAPSTSPSSNSMLYGKPVAVTPLSPEILSSEAYKALVADLRRGGYVIYLRHALTVSAPEPAVGDLADCTWQRNLSDDGRRQAASVGSRLSEQGIPVATLEASPFCRTRQTAELAFGRAPQVNADLLYHSTQTPEQFAAAKAKLKARLAAPPPAGGNVVLVGHSPTMKQAAAVELPEGQGAIVKPTGDGSFRIVARLTEAGITPVPFACWPQPGGSGGTCGGDHSWLWQGPVPSVAVPAPCIACRRSTAAISAWRKARCSRPARRSAVPCPTRRSTRP